MAETLIGLRRYKPKRGAEKGGRGNGWGKWEVHSLGGSGGQREGLHIIEARRRHGERALDQTRSGGRFGAPRGIVAPAAELAASDRELQSEAHCRSVAQDGQRRRQRSEKRPGRGARMQCSVRGAMAPALFAQRRCSKPSTTAIYLRFL
jgi:hypothetical protein